MYLLSTYPTIELHPRKRIIEDSTQVKDIIPTLQESGCNRRHIIIVSLQEQLLYAEMERIVLAETVEELARIMEELQDGCE